MAKKKARGNRTAKRSAHEDETAETDERPGLWESMDGKTVRGIAGVVLVVVAIVLALSSLGLAGVVGDTVYWALHSLVGVGYFLVPVMLVAWAVSLFSSTYEENTLRPIRTAGVVLFFLAALSLIAVLSPKHGGVIGSLIASPMVAYLETIATIVILAGLIIVALLLLFDSELWILLLGKVRALFSREPVEEELRENEEAYTTDDEEEAPYEAEPLESTPPEEEELPAVAPREGPAPASPKQRGKKRVEQFVMPTEYKTPPLDLLESDRGKANVGDTKAYANTIKKTLQHFKIPVEMDEIVVGPTVTQYSLKPAAGVRLNKIVSLQQNLELALAASPIRIEAPIPGKSLVGIEVPNSAKAFVGLAGLLKSPEFTEEQTPLLVAIGKDIAGGAHYADIGKMPHLLVAGTTGSGKSVMIHTLVTSLLYRNSPEEVRFIMVDPKRVELTLYDGIPHLLTPVVTEAKKCILALKWAVKEMDRRYDVLREHQVQSIGGYHEEVLAPAYAAYEKQKAKGKDVEDVEMPENMPHIIVIIDELADIMTAYPRELESVIVRLAQMSRAVGIHLILSTQRPSKEVITGLIKANIPTRIALKVSSLLESRIILDQPGAEKLLGKGDLLYLGGDMPKARRLQSPFLTTEEVKKVAAFLKKHNDYMLEETIDFTNGDGKEGGSGGGLPFGDLEKDDERDALYGEIRNYVIREQKASTSLIQRRFRIGYGRAARIMDMLEEDGVIASADGTNRPREVLMRAEHDAFDPAESTTLDEDEESESEDDGEEDDPYER